MSILIDILITQSVKSGALGIHPFDPEAVQPASYDLKLSPTIKIARQAPHVFERFPSKEELEETMEAMELSASFVLRPGQFILGGTAETVTLPDNMALTLHNRSSLARLGINVAISSYANPGYSGQLPLCIHNHGPYSIPLVPHMRICQALFHVLPGACERPYMKREGKYMHENPANVSNLASDPEFVAFNAQKPRSDDMFGFLENRALSVYQDFINDLGEEEKAKLGLGSRKENE